MFGKTSAEEVNFDGIPGPTHNYSGLSLGNVASMSHQAQVSRPKLAALQALKKMWRLAELGLYQAVLPPQERPFVPTLRSLGFSGEDHEVIATAYRENPILLAQCSSASCMWTANAATVCPSVDSLDARVHFTPANLQHHLHRAIETESTSKVLREIFNDPRHFAVHDPLPASPDFSDEGAANHNRFCRNYRDPGLQLFVYGRRAGQKDRLPQKYPARQTLEACQAQARLHLIASQQCLFAQQSPAAIDAGVFHNDVISVANRNAFLYHEQAFIDQEQLLSELRERMETVCGCELISLPVSSDEVSLEQAVSSYLFNSQLISLSDAHMALIAPAECEAIPAVKAKVEAILSDNSNPISEVHYLDVRESMQNGGGPACLRLRVVLTPAELKSINPYVLLTQRTYEQLTAWVEKHYRDELYPDDLRDPSLLNESRTALDELTQILHLGSLYPFQGATKHACS